MAAFSAGQTLTAADLLGILPVWAVKAADEQLTSSTTLQNDDALFVAGAANTTYAVDLTLLYTEAAGTSIDIKVAWTQPVNCILDLAIVAPHLNWVASPPAGTLEVEWVAWQNQTATTTATRSFGTLNGTQFSMHARGVWRVGSTAGNLQLQWCQNASSASALTVLAGSALRITPLLS